MSAQVISLQQQSVTTVTDYLAHGWKLCAIPPGTKGPNTPNWQKLENALTEPPPEGWGVGLLHAYSGTAALDIDQWADAAVWLAERGVILPNLMDAPDAVGIDSGNAGHGKLLYSLPFPLPTKKVVIGNKTILEFRCGTASGLSAQDVLPGSRHPSGSIYTWTGSGNWQQLPVIPDELLAVWMQLLAGDAQKNIKVEGEQSPVSLDELRKAMFSVSPNCDRKPWTEIGMGWKAAGGDRDSWEEWSSGSKEKYHPSEIESQWKSFDDPDKVRKDGIGPGTVFFHAIAGGWKRPAPEVKGLFGPVPEQSGDREQGIHPMLQYQTGYDNEGTEFVIDGVIAEGPVILPADRGLGKTTAIVSLACKVTHLCPENDPLRPTIRRNVVYLTEDPKQVQRILYAMGRDNQFGLEGDTFEGRLEEAFTRIKIVPTARLSPEVIVQVAGEYHKTLTVPNERNGVRYDAPPWVIFDTTSASIDLEEENSNSEISKAVALMKREFYLKREIPFLLVAHTAKAMKHAEVSKLSARGGGAWEADVYQVIYMSTDDKGGRFLEIGTPNAKKRFSPKFYSIAVGGHTKECVVTNRFKEVTVERITWASLTPMTSEEVTGIKEKAEMESEFNREEVAIRKVMVKVEKFFELNPGFMGSKNKVVTMVGSKKAHVLRAIDLLIKNESLGLTDSDDDGDEQKVVYSTKNGDGDKGGAEGGGS